MPPVIEGRGVQRHSLPVAQPLARRIAQRACSVAALINMPFSSISTVASAIVASTVIRAVTVLREPCDEGHRAVESAGVISADLAHDLGRSRSRSWHISLTISAHLAHDLGRSHLDDVERDSVLSNTRATSDCPPDTRLRRYHKV